MRGCGVQMIHWAVGTRSPNHDARACSVYVCMHATRSHPPPHTHTMQPAAPGASAVSGGAQRHAGGAAGDAVLPGMSEEAVGAMVLLLLLQ